ncbi:hypothetical protein AVEN_272364-1 [Araneus ventricosus]|uniref:Uncharacterized protein n=1 Tax=Araneus ventricosus TaxID=182803 RepID=A0A4Y2GRC9_ARAVE|nr:hypothetical protein AVEN_272364-1 [Araneus ventricosus]
MGLAPLTKPTLAVYRSSQGKFLGTLIELDVPYVARINFLLFDITRENLDVRHVPVNNMLWLLPYVFPTTETTTQRNPRSNARGTECANLGVRECLIFWEKASIPTRETPHYVENIMKMYNHYRNLQKSACRRSEMQEENERNFISDLNN